MTIYPNCNTCFALQIFTVLIGRLAVPCNTYHFDCLRDIFKMIMTYILLYLSAKFIFFYIVCSLVRYISSKLLGPVTDNELNL